MRGCLACAAEEVFRGRRGMRPTINWCAFCKHGHWIFTNAHYYGLDCALYYYKCSICGELVLKDIKYGVGNYCLHCGAKMDEEV